MIDPSLPPVPAELARIADVIGAEPTLALIEAHGGTRLYVPHALTPGHKLIKLLGREAAQRLVAQHGGARLAVPLCKWWVARCYRARGDSIIKIARRLNASERAVWGYLRGEARGRTVPQMELLL